MSRHACVAGSYRDFRDDDMASYSLSLAAIPKTVAVTVSGLSAGDQIWIYCYDQTDYTGTNLGGGPYTVTGLTYMTSFELEYEHTYAFNVATKDGYLGRQDITTGKAPGPSRPQNWSWSGIIYSGAPLENLTADVWNSFTSRINEFRRYKGQGNYGFTSAVSGVTDISTGAAEAMAAIRGLTGHGTLPAALTIEASTWVQLAAAMNAVT